MSETKHTCGECFHFDACKKMLESVLDPTWNVAIIPAEKSHACQDFIEASLVMSSFRVAERLRGSKDAKPSKKCVNIKLTVSEAAHLRRMAGSRIDKLYDSISIYEEEGVKVPDWLEEELKEKSGIYDKIQQAIDDYYR